MPKKRKKSRAQTRKDVKELPASLAVKANPHGDNQAANAAPNSKRKKQTDRQFSSSHNMRRKVQVTLYIAGVLFAICFGLATLFLADGHNRDLGLWATFVAIVVGLFGVTCFYQNWLWEKDAAKARQTEGTHTENVLDVPHATDQLPQKPEAHEQPNKATETHKHPTLEHICKTIRDTPPLSQTTVTQQFIDVPVSWDGVLSSSGTIGDHVEILIDTIGPNARPSGNSFWVPIELPKHNFLLQAPKGTPLHVDGVIGEIRNASFITLKAGASVRLRSE